MTILRDFHNPASLEAIKCPRLKMGSFREDAYTKCNYIFNHLFYLSGICQDEKHLRKLNTGSDSIRFYPCIYGQDRQDLVSECCSTCCKVSWRFCTENHPALNSALMYMINKSVEKQQPINAANLPIKFCLPSIFNVSAFSYFIPQHVLSYSLSLFSYFFYITMVKHSVYSH